MADNSANYSVYLLKCSDGTYYCGITTDIERRIKQHNNGAGAKYTRGRSPVKLLAYTSMLSRASALKLEHKVKSVRKADKILWF